MKVFKNILLILVSIIMLAGVDPSNGTCTIEFNLTTLNPDSILHVMENPREDENKYLQVVWNTGDTGRSIKITKPGLYIASVKDSWLTEGGRIKGVFVKGLPDSVRIDTIIEQFSGSVFDPIITERSLKLNICGEVQYRTYTDIYQCYNDECDSVLWTETHKLWEGFWSGLIDSILVIDVKTPLIIEANSIIIDNQNVSISEWELY